MVGTDFANKDWFLFGLGLNSDLSPVAGNGVPGALADRTLSVAAWGVNAIDKDGNVVPVSGNSFAAPTIAGAAALLKQYWPPLGGKEISQILLGSATDLVRKSDVKGKSVSVRVDLGGCRHNKKK